MNIFSKIKEAKNKAMANYELRKEERAVRTAEEAKLLRERRIKAEAREKIYIERDTERQKLKEVNSNLRKRTPAYRIANALKENYKKYQKNKKKPTFGNLPGQNWNM